jgi:hypothetical protein
VDTVVGVDTAGGLVVALIWAAGSVAATWAAGSAALTWAGSAAAMGGGFGGGARMGSGFGGGHFAGRGPALGRGLAGQHAEVRGHFARDHFHRGRRFGFGGGYDDWCYDYPYYTPNCYLYGY